MDELNRKTFLKLAAAGGARFKGAHDRFGLKPGFHSLQEFPDYLDVPTLRADTAKLLGREHLGFSTHEQYFFKDYLAYQPDYMEKVMVMCEMMRANGYRFIFLEDLAA